MNEFSAEITAIRDELSGSLEKAGRKNVSIDVIEGQVQRPDGTYVTRKLSKTLDTGTSELRFFLGSKSYEFQALNERTYFNSKDHPDYLAWVDSFHALNAEKQAAWTEVWLPLMQLVAAGELAYDGEFESIDDVLDFAAVVAAKAGVTTDSVIDKWVEKGVLYEKEIAREIEVTITFRAYDNERKEYIANLDKMVGLHDPSE